MNLQVTFTLTTKFFSHKLVYYLMFVFSINRKKIVVAHKIFFTSFNSIKRNTTFTLSVCLFALLLMNGVILLPYGRENKLYLFY